MRNLRTASSDAVAMSASQKIEDLQAAISRVIRGKPEAVRLAVVTLLAGGHLPIEDHGTYPLPESQLDRFMLRLRIGYPGAGDERQILRDREHAEPLDEMQPVMSATDVLELQEAVTEVSVDDAIVDYLMRIVAA